MKKCRDCKEEKELDCFCKDKNKKDGHATQCRDCTKKHRELNKEKISIKKKEYYQNNKENIKEKRELNKEKIKSRKKEYEQNNKEKKNAYKRNKRKNDPLMRMKESIRSSINQSFRNISESKNSKTEQIIGCTFQELYKHLETQFETWMTWKNYGKYNGELNFGWDIDHKIPLTEAKNIDDIIKLNHFTNLKPLCSYTNRHIKRGNR